jgi:hypothetical protein
MTPFNFDWGGGEGMTRCKVEEGAGTCFLDMISRVTKAATNKTTNVVMGKIKRSLLFMFIGDNHFLKRNENS